MSAAIDLWIDFRAEEDAKNFVSFALSKYPALKAKQIKVAPDDVRGGSGSVVIYDLKQADVDAGFFFELALLGVDLQTAPDDEEDD